MTHRTLKDLGSHRVRLISIKLNGFDTGHPSVLVLFRRVRGAVGYGAKSVSSPYGYYIPLTEGNEVESAHAIQNVLRAFGDKIDVTTDEKPLTRVLNHAMHKYRDPVYGIQEGRINVIRARSASNARITKVLWGVDSLAEAAARDLVIALRTDPIVGARIDEITKRYLPVI